MILVTVKAYSAVLFMLLRIMCWRILIILSTGIGFALFSYQKATQSELSNLKDWCAVCWEQMDSARKLPCNHFFHEWCAFRSRFIQRKFEIFSNKYTQH